MLSESRQVKNNFIKDENDIFSNPTTNEIAHQNFTNIRRVQFLDGFEIDEDGTFNLSKPIFKDLDGAGYNSITNVSKICILTEPSDNPLASETEDDFESAGDTFILEDENDNSEQEEVTNFGPYYVLGTSTMGMTEGMYGYYFPVYLAEEPAREDSVYTGIGTPMDPETGDPIPEGTAHSHTFSEYPGITFYMPDLAQNHAKEQPPGGIGPYIGEAEQRSNNSSTNLNYLAMHKSSFESLISTTNPVVQHENYAGIANELQTESLLVTDTSSVNAIEAAEALNVTAPTSAAISAGVTGGTGYGY